VCIIDLGWVIIRANYRWWWTKFHQISFLQCRRKCGR